MNRLYHLLLCLFTAGALSASLPLRASDRITFEGDVAPILSSHCQKCHGDVKRESNFDVRRRFTLVQGGDTGPAIVPGEPGESLLIELIEDGQMPPKGEPRLTDVEIETLRRWIAEGAETKSAAELPLSHDDQGKEKFNDVARTHWAFQPIQNPAPPDVHDDDWVLSPIDAFMLKKLEEQNWQPAPTADRSVFIRRVTFDLTGLPPTPAEVAAFVQDSSPQAYEILVDRLLQSSAYGERWAQHWLDVIRFAESEGFEYDRHLPDAWRFRDYVIDSLNADKPFDQFIREQLAGDELRPADYEYQTAVVFHRLGAVRRNAGNPDIALSRNEVLTERTNIVGEAFLGLTIGCARCHNHKLEPITQRDYYRLQAYFAATEEHDVKLAEEDVAKAWDEKTEALNRQIKKLKDQSVQSDGAEKERIDAQIKALKAQLPEVLPSIPSIRNDFENRTAIHVLRRGVWEQKGIAVGPRPLSILTDESLSELPVDCRSPRTALADWIVSPEHPLTTRVLVNRVWQQHFGTGIVATANDFGTHGSSPSHPELLDWLAQQLIANEWRLKPLHRMIVLSQTYRQSSSSDAAGKTMNLDPENRLLWRFPRRRLSGEEIRDAMLAVSGRLNLKSHGPSIMLPVDPQLVGLLYDTKQWEVTEDPAEHDRRSIYLIAKRNLRLPFMEAFDAPALQTSCPLRESSTHAPQALELLNGEFANAMAGAFAQRLERECAGDPEQVIARAFQLALNRAPTQTEESLSLRFLQTQPVSEFALAVFNLNGFVYVE